MDFPPNTIYHSLHHFFPKSKFIDTNAYHDVWFKSTLHLLTVFEKMGPTPENLFLAATSLNLTLLLSNHDFHSSYFERCKAIFNTDAQNLEEHDGIYEENKMELKQLFAHCVAALKRAGTKRKTGSDMENWATALVNFASKNNDYSNNGTHDIITNIFFTVRTQLGVSNHTLIDYLLFRILSDEKTTNSSYLTPN